MAKIMGILNVTNDSFFPSSRYSSYELAVAQGIKMDADGADWIDIGGESTRPGALTVPVEEEMQRIVPVVEKLKSCIKKPLSIDTTKVKVAEQAIKAGASLINDVSGFRCQEMVELAASSGVKVCAMHMLKDPKTMQDNPFYEKGVIDALLFWFEEVAKKLIIAGVKQEHIILDPGIGFGKTVADNFEILQNLPKLKAIGFPLLLGISRKSFMGKVLNVSPEHLLPATLVLNAFAICAVDYIRVHDVLEHRQALNVLQMLVNK